MNKSITAACLSYILILLFVTLVCIQLYFINGKSLIGIDDANIYMVYMRNFANGKGFVFNVGGEHVQGFTSLLWTLIGSVFYIVGARPEPGLLIVNLVVVSYSIWKVWSLIQKRFRRFSLLSSYGFLFLALLISLPGYFEWTILSLMESGLWSSLLILSVINILELDLEQAKKSNIQFSVLLVFTILCRPEAVVWCAFFLMMRFLKTISVIHQKRQALSLLILPMITYLITVILLLIWQKSYFGYFLPNTYYAKVSNARFDNIRAGLKYLAEYFKKAPFVFLIFILLIRQLADYLNNNRLNGVFKFSSTFPLQLFAGIFLITFMMPLISGGDHFSFFRMIQPTVPIFLLYFLFATDYFRFPLSLSWNILIVFFVLISSDFSLFYSIRNLYSPLKGEWEIAVADRNTSEKLNRYFQTLPRYPSQGVMTAGASAYSYNGVTIDLLGLNNTKMAHADPIKDNAVLKDHASFNKTVFYEQRPDLFWLVGAFSPNNKIEKLDIPAIRTLVFKGIADDKEFYKEYVQCIIFKKGDPENLQIFASNRFLNSLDTAYYTVLRFN